MKSNKVSVVMPCYNYVNYITDSIESILNQSYANLELILIDNASTDGTKEIIQSFAAKDPRIKAIYHKKNMGIGFSFTEGMQVATGDFIAFNSSDDLWHKNKLETQVKALSENPDVDIFHSDAYVIDSDGKTTGKTIKTSYNLNPKDGTGDIFLLLTRKNVCCSATVIFRRKCLKTCDHFDSELNAAHDWWFYVELSKKHHFLYQDMCLADYRIHSQNFSNKLEVMYTDYAVIHKRLATMGVEPQRHLIYAAVASVLIGKKEDAVALINESKKYGKLNLTQKALEMIIKLPGDNKEILLALLKLKNAFIGSLPLRMNII